MSASLECEAGGPVCRVAGTLDFQTVPALWRQIEQRMAEGELTLDLAGVDSANSAGLVLLLEAIEVAQRRRVPLDLRGIPEVIYEIAAMYNARALLPGTGAD